MRDFVRRTWYLAGGLPLALGLAVVPLAVTIGPIPRAVVITVALVSGLWLYVVFVVLWSGAADRMMGAAAEQSTSDVLREASKRGWRSINGVQVDEGWDIDHVAVGPGGVLVVETKWSGHPWPINGYGPRFQESKMKNAGSQACSNANSLRDHLPGLDRSHIVPIGVFWSGAKKYGSGWIAGPDKRTVLVHGRSFREWLASLPEDVLDQPTMERAWSSLELIATGSRDAVTRTDTETIPSLRELGTQWGLLGPLGGLGAVVAFGLATLGHSEPLDLLVPATGICIGISGRRHRSVRGLATGWLVLSTPIFLALASAAVYDAIT